MFHILIVDEEEHLLWALENNLLPERDDLVIMTASTGELGLELLREHPIDVLICDIKMPGKVDGFQLILRAKEVAPDARVVIMTAFGTNRIQNLAERIGITHYIEKPFSVSDLRNVVLELLDAKEGFQGVLSDLELTDIIQMLCLAKRTSMLHLKHKEHRGKIVFERGDVVHAEFDEIVGAQAVYAMLALKQGDIYMQTDFSNEQHTINVGWQDLLLEGVRLSDEAQMDNEEGEDSEELSDFGPPQLVPPTMSEAAMSLFSDAELEELEAATMDTELGQTPGGLEANSQTTAGFPSHASLHPFRSDSSESSESSETSEVSEPLPMDPNEDSQFGPVNHRRPGRPVDVMSDHTPFQREITQPTAIAKETSSPHWQERQESTLEEESAITQQEARPHSTNRVRKTNPGFQTSSLGGGAVRELLMGFLQETFGTATTGIFSLDDGLALDFVHNPHLTNFDEDVLSAFYREVFSGGAQIVSSLIAHDQCREVQLTLANNIVLMRPIENTPYIHIAMLNKDVRLGIAIVLMRRYGAKLAKCF